MAPTTTAQLAQRQIHQWNLACSRLDPGETSPRPVRPNITISRRLGSGARKLAEHLSRRRGMMIHGSSLVDAIARDKGLKREMVAQLDETTRSGVDIWVEGILNRRLFSHSEFHVALAKTIRTLATCGHSIFLGRGANMILDPEHCLRLRVVASHETRLSNVIDATGVKLDEALTMIEESDAGRCDFMRRFFGVELDDPLYYDLVINMDCFTLESAGDLILSALDDRNRPGERDLRAQGG